MLQMVWEGTTLPPQQEVIDMSHFEFIQISFCCSQKGWKKVEEEEEKGRGEGRGGVNKKGTKQFSIHEFHKLQW